MLSPESEKTARLIAARVAELLQDQRPSTPQEYLSPQEAATFLGTCIRTLENWRLREGGGPPFIRITRSTVRYRVSDLIEWMEARRVEE